jgi:hypothetical protein
MCNKTDSMIKASMIAGYKEEIVDFELSSDKASKENCKYAVSFFESLILDRQAKIEYLRNNLINPAS